MCKCDLCVCFYSILQGQQSVEVKHGFDQRSLNYACSYDAIVVTWRCLWMHMVDVCSARKSYLVSSHILNEWLAVEAANFG